MNDDSKNKPVGTQGRESLTGRTGNQATSQTIPSKPNIKVGRHGAEMIMTSDPEKNERMLTRVGIPQGMETPATLEERLRLVQRLISQSMGISLDESQVPAKIGFDISTESQRKLLFGVLEMMSGTDYRGTYQVPNEQVLNPSERGEKSVKALTEGYQVLTGARFGGAYRNIPSTPVLKINDRNLMIATGFDPDSHFDRESFRKAKGDLCFKQNFLMYTRFARDEKGRVIKEKNGKTKFELVSMFSSVLNLKVIADPQTKQPLYNEISLAPVFFDEISRDYGGTNGGYFLLIPSDCTREITETYRRLFPRKERQTPPVIHSLCWWFRLRVQDRQNKERNPLTKWNQRKSQSTGETDNVLRIGFFDLCRQLDYGERAIKKNRKRILNSLTDGIDVALELGYLTGYSYDEETDEFRFDLNLDYYPNGYKDDGVETQETPGIPSEEEPRPERETQGELFS